MALHCSIVLLPASATVTVDIELNGPVNDRRFVVLHILFHRLFNNNFYIVACYKIVDNHTVRAFVACGTFNLLCYLACMH